MTTFIDYCINEDVDSEHECIVEMDWFGAKIFCNNIYCNFVEENIAREDISSIIEIHGNYHGNE